ncbi:peptidase inhibitor family I36 protein [Streptomyces sp. NRRL F-5123]|uniref:peptidase inhibitor family I36 protein n=1 Tax=Streptomyces sp. NRRL F-5123 TaxID=1463856 RepID=UPI000694CFFB|nr:peptidase inhibitor family I36 protein [Streptomyces sp. NRRL F-5123]
MAVATGGAQAVSAPGGAATCPSNSVCLYYNSPENGWGAFEYFSPGQRGLNLSNFRFTNHGNTGNGYGQVIAMNAASIVNNTDHFVNVYVSQGYYVHYEGHYAGNLNTAYNNDVAMDT